MPARLQFWFDPASTYAYLSAMRIEAMAANRHVEVEWRPFLLGPIFKAQGWDTSPFNIYPAKGRYMVRDIDRIAAARGLQPFRLPDPFPGRSIKAARLALLAADQERIAPFMRALFQKAFADGRDISDGDVLCECLRTAGVPEVDALIAAADEPPVKDRLRRETEHALSLGVFGAPTFVAPDGELFWGDDRLEQAIDWSAAV
jgi:2-hydroxychromene-2-carboxylate isomerase